MYRFIICYIQLTNKTDRYSAHQEVLPSLMKPETSLSHSKQQLLHSTENQFYVVWYGPEGKSCTVTKLCSCLPCRVYPCWSVIRCTMHDARHLTYNTNRNVSESVQSVGSSLAFRHFEVVQHLKRTHIICARCFKVFGCFCCYDRKSKTKCLKLVSYGVVRALANLALLLVLDSQIFPSP